MYQKEPESFGSLLSRNRQDWKLSLEQLSEGLCTPSELARMEKGERTPNKLLRDRLLLRVGVSPDTHESFLFGDDFAPWKLRQQILGAVSRRQSKRAEGLLDEYYKLYVRPSSQADAVYGRLALQFYLSMKAQLLRFEGAKEETLAEIFGEALALSVTRIDESVRGRALCVQEINLFLEYLRHHQPPDAARLFREILDYIECSHLDDVSRARVYPKAICYYYTYEVKSSCSTFTPADCGKAIRLCQAAIKLLRKTGRMYHLWELLTLYGRFLQALASFLDRESPARAAALKPMIAQNDERLLALAIVYDQCRVPRESEDFCYLYIEKEVYCIGDLIRLRRTMAGLSRAQLCKDICSERTLMRLENNQRRTYWHHVRQLFRRLNLAPEYCRTALVTDSQEAIDCLDEMRTCIHNRDHERTDDLIRRIEELVNMELPSNKQTMLRHRALNELQKGALTKKEFCSKVVEALECTLPYETAISAGKKYLTNEELLCIQNIAIESEETENVRKEAIQLFIETYQPYQNDEILNCYINMYETIMGYAMSELGNMGEYKRSDEISQTLMTECLYIRRFYGIYRSIYNMLWNEDQQLKEGILSKRRRNPVEDLQCCIVFLLLCPLPQGITEHLIGTETAYCCC